MSGWLFRLAGIVLLCIGWGCKSKKIVHQSDSPRPAVAIADTLKEVDYIKPKAYAKVIAPPAKYWSSKIKVERVSEGLDIALSGTIRVKTDSIIWCSVNIGLGIEAVRVMITPHSFSLVDHINKQKLTIPIVELATVVGANLTFADLQDLLLGNLPSSLSFAPVQMKDQLQQVRALSTGQLFLGVIETTTGRTLQFKAKQSNSSSLTISYSDFRTFQGIEVPFEKIIETSETSQNGSVTTNLNKLRHTKFQTAEQPLEFPFTLPKDYQDLRP